MKKGGISWNVKFWTQSRFEHRSVDGKLFIKVPPNYLGPKQCIGIWGFACSIVHSFDETMFTAMNIGVICASTNLFIEDVVFENNTSLSL